MNKLIRRFNKSYINSLKNTITTSLLKDTIFLWIVRRKNGSGDPMNLSEKLETMCIAYPEVSSDYEESMKLKQTTAGKSCFSSTYQAKAWAVFLILFCISVDISKPNDY